MEIPSISSTNLGVIQLCQNVYGLLNALRRLSGVHDAEFDQVWRLAISEGERTIAWANYVQFTGQPIPPENVQRVKVLVEKLEDYYAQVDRKLRKIYQPDGRKMTTRLLAQRLMFQAGGFEDIKDSLAAIQAINGALETLASLLLQYPTDSSFSLVNAGMQLLQVGSESPDETSFKDKQPSVPRLSQISLASVYRVCLDMLRSLSMISPFNGRLQPLLTRLELWGIGLFDDDNLRLDDIFRADFDRNIKLREILLRFFVHVLIAEERLLKVVEGNKGVVKVERFTKDHLNLRALLGMEELIAFAIERWGDLQPLPSTKGVEESDCQEEQSSTQDDLDPVDEQATDLHDLMQNLFDLLPAIRSARQTHLLNLEASESNNNVETGSETTVKPVSQIPESKHSGDIAAAQSTSFNTERTTFDTAIERSLRLATDLEEALRADEEFATKHGIKDLQIFSPRFERERERLQKYQQALAQGSNTKLGPKEAAAVSQLIVALNETTKWLIVSNQSEIGMQRGAVVENWAHSGRRVEELLEVFGNSNSVLLGHQVAIA